LCGHLARVTRGRREDKGNHSEHCEAEANQNESAHTGGFFVPFRRAAPKKASSCANSEHFRGRWLGETSAGGGFLARAIFQRTLTPGGCSPNLAIAFAA
jgi:hypothetical protein